ncbi:MAG TPA: ferritin-like domain-containing protein [Solirubrobacteraceae bacterium]|nr:ferritin-like domain-containing protein [Solirubrobacteraceae bacterium]
MSESHNEVHAALESVVSGESAATRRKFVAGAAGAIGSFGLLGLPGSALAKIGKANDAQTILNIAATAEVLATIVNTVGPEKVALDRTTRRNVLDAATEELIHYEVLTKTLGAKPATKKIWIPNAVFSSQKALLETLVVGDGIFVNAYQIGITAFGNAGKGTYARYAAEIMGVESVHRALALQSLGRPGNDQAFASGPGRYFTNITTAVELLEHAGFGFGKKGKGPGHFYDFDRISHQVVKTREVGARTPH